MASDLQFSASASAASGSSTLRSQATYNSSFGYPIQDHHFGHVDSFDSSITVSSSGDDRLRPVQELRRLIEETDTTIDALRRIGQWINDECLRYTTEKNTIENPHLGLITLVRLALALSTPLEPALHIRNSPIFLEVQLRTLIATLALLRFKQVYAFNSDAYNELRSTKLPRLWSDIWAHRSEDMDETRQSTNSYLVQLAYQYLKMFKSVGNVVHDSSEPMLKIVFAAFSLAGQQYGHSRCVIEGIRELALIWRRVKPREHPICGLHEHVRWAVSLLEARQKSPNLDEGAQQLLNQILPELLGEINRLLREDFPQDAEALRRLCLLRRVTQSRPPSLKRGYFYLGLLDCVGQLARLIDLKALPRLGLFAKLVSIVFETEISDIKWKAIEALLAYGPTRGSVSQYLWGILTSRPDSVERALIGKEIMTIENSYKSDGRFGQEPYLDQVTTAENILGFPSLSNAPSASSGSVSDISARRVSTQREWQEKPFPSLNIGGQSQSSPAFRKNLQKESFESVGFSQECDKVFYFSPSKLSVFAITRDFAWDTAPMAHLDRQFPQSEPVSMVVMSLNYEAINTVVNNNQAHKMVISETKSRKQLYEITHQGYEAKTLAIAELDDMVVLILTHYHRIGRATYQGKLLIYVFYKGTGCLLGSQTTSIPNNQFVKQLSISPQADCVAAITNLNTLLAWKLDCKTAKLSPPFSYWHGQYDPDVGYSCLKDKGLTSASIFQPEGSDNQYIFCTSFPSLRRHHSEGNWGTQGEWSYLTPVMPPSAQPPASMVQNLTQLAEYGKITSGCVSNKTNIFAVLTKCEKTVLTNRKRKGDKISCRRSLEPWKVQLLALQAHDRGGVCCVEEEPKMLDFTLQGADTTSPTTPCAIGFDSAGTHLFAADFKGRIFVTRFE